MTLREVALQVIDLAEEDLPQEHFEVKAVPLLTGSGYERAAVLREVERVMDERRASLFQLAGRLAGPKEKV